MAIRGSLQEASLPDVLQLLAMGGKTGCLDLNVTRESGSIFFDSGRVCFARINGRQLGIEDSVYAMFTWSNGSFSFEPGIPPPAGAHLVSVDSQALLLEGARRVDEWSLIQKRLPEFEVVFALDRQQLLRNGTGLTPEQQQVIPLIDGNRDVHELIRASGLGEFVTGKALYGLLTGGFVVAVGRREGQSDAAAAIVAEHRNLGIAFYKARMYSDAAREFRRMLELRRNDAAANFFLGLIALRDERWQEAAEFLQAAAAAAPRARSTFVDLGYAYERLGQLEKARLAMQQAIAGANKPEPLAHLGLAAVALYRNLPAEAEGPLGDARRAWGGSTPPAVWYHYASLAAVMRGDTDRGVTLLEDAVRRYPAAAVLLNNLAVIQESRGNFDAARALIERAAQSNRAIPQLYRNLGDALRRAGKPEEARAAYERASNTPTAARHR